MILVVGLPPPNFNFVPTPLLRSSYSERMIVLLLKNYQLKIPQSNNYKNYIIKSLML